MSSDTITLSKEERPRWLKASEMADLLSVSVNHAKKMMKEIALRHPDAVTLASVSGSSRAWVINLAAIIRACYSDCHLASRTSALEQRLDDVEEFLGITLPPGEEDGPETPLQGTVHTLPRRGRE